MSEHSYLNPHEKARIFQARALVLFNASQLNEIEKIVANLEQALALGALPEEDQLATEYRLGQAYYTQNRFTDAAKVFASFAARAKEITADQHFLMADTFDKAERVSDGLPHAQKAVDGAPKPDEERLRLLLALHYKLKHDAEVATTLTRLIEAYPKREDYLQLSATYAVLDDKPQAIAALEAADAKEFLREELEFVGLARLYLQTHAPLKAAAVLDKQMQAGEVERTPENLELLARAKLALADVDGAQAALSKMGNVAASGDVYAEVGRLEVERGQWDKARVALALAVQSGSLSAPGQTRLWLGIAHYNAKSKSSAVISFNEAKKHPEAAACADQWLAVVTSGKAASPSLCTVAPTDSAAK